MSVVRMIYRSYLDIFGRTATRVVFEFEGIDMAAGDEWVDENDGVQWIDRAGGKLAIDQICICCDGGREVCARDPNCGGPRIPVFNAFKHNALIFENRGFPDELVDTLMGLEPLPELYSECPPADRRNPAPTPFDFRRVPRRLLVVDTYTVVDHHYRLATEVRVPMLRFAEGSICCEDDRQVGSADPNCNNWAFVPDRYSRLSLGTMLDPDFDVAALAVAFSGFQQVPAGRCGYVHHAATPIDIVRAPLPTP